MHALETVTFDRRVHLAREESLTEIRAFTTAKSLRRTGSDASTQNMRACKVSRAIMLELFCLHFLPAFFFLILFLFLHVQLSDGDRMLADIRAFNANRHLHPPREESAGRRVSVSASDFALLFSSHQASADNSHRSGGPDLIPAALTTVMEAESPQIAVGTADLPHFISPADSLSTASNFFFADHSPVAMPLAHPSITEATKMDQHAIPDGSPSINRPPPLSTECLDFFFVHTSMAPSPNDSRGRPADKDGVGTLGVVASPNNVPMVFLQID